MGTSVFGIAQSRDQASRIVEALRVAGFPYSAISALSSDKSGTHDLAAVKETKAPEGAATGAGAGGLVGGALGLLAGIGALAIPGVGPLIAAGPILATLSGTAVGAAVGGVAGALVGLGIPEYEAKRYEGKIIGGSVLLAVHTDSADQTKRAKEILENQGAEDVHSVGEAAPDIKVVPKPATLRPRV